MNLRLALGRLVTNVRFIIGAAILLFIGAVILFVRNEGALSVLGMGIALVEAGGAIAYLGDWLGYTMGKKRFSVVGLRPRQTARVASVAAGSLTALLTFSILYGLDTNFRRALEHGNDLVQQARQLTQQNNQLAAEERRLIRSRTALEISESAAKHEAVVANAITLHAELTLNEVSTQLNAQRTALTVAERELQSRQVRLAVAASQLTVAQKAVAVAVNEGNALRKQNAAVKADLALLDETARTAITRSRTSALTYHNEQEVGRVIIEQGKADDIESQLYRFLNRLSGDAIQAGAAAHFPGRAVKVASVQVEFVNGTSTTPVRPIQVVEEADSLRALAENIHSSGLESVVVIAYSVGNSFAGERVLVRMKPYINRLAVHAGTVLGQIRLNGDRHQAPEILNAIQTLLSRDARNAAMAAGVIPVQSSTNQQAELGQLPISEIVQIVDDAQEIKGPEVISAIVPTDVYSGDRLAVRIVVNSVAVASLGPDAARPLARSVNASTEYRARVATVATRSKRRTWRIW